MVANVMKGSPMRLGLRLTSGLFDLGALQLRDAASLESLLGSLRDQALERERLPVEWRAAVADLAQLLRGLHAQTEGLDDDARRCGLEYAGHLLLPLVYEGPIHRRAYDKPQVKAAP